MNTIRKDIHKIDITNKIHILVFHKTFDDGFGPSLSLYNNGNECLKFDCFGDKGHYHINNGKRIFFDEKMVEDQISYIFNSYLTDDMFIKYIDEIKNRMHEYENIHYKHLR